MVSLGTDGAATMMGKRTGVGVQLQSKCSPFMVQSHCIAHKLALAANDALKEYKPLETFKLRFNSLFWHMNASAIRTGKLAKIQEVLHDPVLRMKEPHAVRWLSLRNAVEAVHRSYASVVTTLSELGAEGNTTAEALCKYFGNQQTALLTSFMLDIHRHISILSKQLQKESLLFSEVKPLIDGTLSALRHLSDNDGESLTEMKKMITESNEENKVEIKGVHLSKVNNLQNFNQLRKKYVASLIANIESRYDQNVSEVFNWLGAIFEPKLGFDASRGELAINKLAGFYGKNRSTTLIDDEGTEVVKDVLPLLDGSGLKAEWITLNGMLSGSYADLDTKQLCTRIILLHGDMLPNASKLCQIALCMAVTSVECERCFSVQNRLKTRYRCSLNTEGMNNLMEINLLGNDVDSFDVVPAIQMWQARKKRRQGRLAMPYKTRKSK